MYSLGIVLCELYHPFSTQMERGKTIDAVKAGSVPRDLKKRWEIGEGKEDALLELPSLRNVKNSTWTLSLFSLLEGGILFIFTILQKLTKYLVHLRIRKRFRTGMFYNSRLTIGSFSNLIGQRLCETVAENSVSTPRPDFCCTSPYVYLCHFSPRFPSISKHILSLTSVEPALRPSAADLLREAFPEEARERRDFLRRIAELEECLREKNRIIEELRRRLGEQEGGLAGGQEEERL